MFCIYNRSEHKINLNPFTIAVGVTSNNQTIIYVVLTNLLLTINIMYSCCGEIFNLSGANGFFWGMLHTEVMTFTLFILTISV